MGEAVTSVEGRYCRGCSYDLRGIDSRRCPECGREFDPAQPRTFRRKPRSSLGRWAKRLSLVLGILLILVSLPYAWLYYQWRQEQPAIARMKQLGGDVTLFRIAPPLAARLVPKRFAWLLDRVGAVYPLNGHSPLTDADLKLLGRCRRMVILYADVSDVSGAGIGELAGLAQLRQLWLRGKGITDAIAAALGRCSQPTTLYLRGTSLTDEGLRSLSQFPKLDWLGIESDHLSGRGLGSLRNLPALRRLDLYSNAIREENLEGLASLPGLKWLDVCSDACTAAAQERLRRDHPGIKIRLYSRSGKPVSD